MDKGSRQPAMGKAMLDARLLLAYEMIPFCQICADIGADHGKLSAALLSEGRVQHMLVADISEKALLKARKLLTYGRLADQATFFVADGLFALKALDGQRADAVCILGMGGDTMARVLTQGKQFLYGATLVLGAQTELPVLRQALCDVGYRLREECPVEASGRMYILMRATPQKSGEAVYTRRELLLGPCLLETCPREWEPVLRRRETLLRKAQMAMEQAQNQKNEERIAAVIQELAYVREALAMLEDRARREGKHDGSGNL